MITSKVNRIVGLSEDKLTELITAGQLLFSEARLIPILKTGDEMALTSIFLSALRLVKEFRNSVFKVIKFPRSGKLYYFTEVKIPELSNLRFDGMIICIKSGKVADAVVFEMKKESNVLDQKQIEEYVSLALKLRIPKLVSVTNQFVSHPEQFPIELKHSKRISLFHFSWTSLLTIAHILLFENETNIEDQDQVEIMKEVLHYLEGEKSGVKNYTKMSNEWKLLTESIAAHKALKVSDPILENAILSWYEEEKDMALKLSRELGVNVKSKTRTKDSIKADKKNVIKSNIIQTSILVKNAISEIIVKSDFEKKNVLMSVTLNPPATSTNNGKVTYLIKQLERANKKSERAFSLNVKNVYITANIKYSRTPVTVGLNELVSLKSLPTKVEIKDFEIYVVKEFGRKFTSGRGFVTTIEDLLLSFYEGYVQHLVNWNKPAPKIKRLDEHSLAETD